MARVASGSGLKIVFFAGAVVLLTAGLPASAAVATHHARPVDTTNDWSMWGYDSARTGFNPNETILSTSTVQGLHLLWRFPFALQSDNSPVYASGVTVGDQTLDMLYAGDRSGTFYGIDAATGTEVWSRNLGPPQMACGGMLGVTDTALLDRSRGVLYVAGTDGNLHALDLATGAEAPGWPLQIRMFPNEFFWGGINVYDDQLYVPVASGCDRLGTDYGRVVRVDPSTATQTAVFYVTGGPDTGVSGGGIWGWGGVSIDPANGDVYEVSANGFPQDPYEHFLYAESIVRLDPDLSVISSDYPGLQGEDVDFGSTPVLFDAPHACGPQAFTESKTGEIFLYDRDDLAAGPVDRIAVSAMPLIGVPAWDPQQQLLLVGNRTPSLDGTYQRGLLAFHIGKDCKLKLAWQRGVPNGAFSSSPVSANGVIYFGGANRLSAFDAATHKLLWKTKRTFTGPSQTEPIVVDGHVYLSTDTGLYAYGL